MSSTAFWEWSIVRWNKGVPSKIFSDNKLSAEKVFNRLSLTWDTARGLLAFHDPKNEIKGHVGDLAERYPEVDSRLKLIEDAANTSSFPKEVP
jgi:hypothetical protein